MYYKGEKLKTRPAQDTDFHGYGKSIRNCLSELIPGDEDLRVLDVGTGMGTTSSFLLKRLSKGSRVWSIDPSEEIISGARSDLSAKESKRIEFVRGEADDLKFDDGSFDIVVSVMVMHHIESIRTPIAETSRVLRSGGRLVVIDYSPQAHSLGFQSRHAEEDFFTAKSVAAAARAAGLKIRIEDHEKWYLVEATK